MANHEKYMREALDLATRGLGAVEPNPMVGAVIVRDAAVIGRGWHKAFGGPHAEINAIADARTAGCEMTGATMYVTLEPCCHQGKTPPCTQAILKQGITTVVAAMADPDPNVSGKGFAELRAGGVKVVEDVCRDEARRLLAAYCKLRTRGRPWVIAKWAQTLDGRIATRTGHSRWISSDLSRQRVHALRSVCDGIAVGAGTVKADDPLLTNRSGSPRRPTRVVLDDGLEIPAEGQLLQTVAQAPVLIATTEQALQTRSAHADRLRHLGAEIFTLPAARGGVNLGALLDELGRRQWTRLLVEGGAGVLGSLLTAGLADELNVFVANRLLGGREGLPPILSAERDTMDEAIELPAPAVEAIDSDLLLTYRLVDSYG